eukprot:348179_1
MFLHKEIRSYLLELHKKNGGNLNDIKARIGGNLRGTLSSFTNIPKVIRLDVINPITHTVLYYRWVEMEINDIEDYQLLTSLITSICPEIGMNFMIYYCNNEYFKTSKKQFPVDTIPKFSTLKK